LTKWGKKLKWEKGEDSGAQEWKGEAGLGNKGELHLILLADKQTPTTASTHTHPHIHSLCLLHFCSKKTTHYHTPHSYKYCTYRHTPHHTHSTQTHRALSLSLSLSLFFSASSSSGSRLSSFPLSLCAKSKLQKSSKLCVSVSLQSSSSFTVSLSVCKNQASKIKQALYL
jgi:hypothetical protein